MNIIVYIDSCWKNFLPLTYPRAVFQLLCGRTSLIDKVRRLAPDTQIALSCRSMVAPLVAEQTGLAVNSARVGETLFLSGRGWWKKLPECEEDGDAWVGVVGTEQRVACIFAKPQLALKLSADTLLDNKALDVVLANLPRRDVSDCVELFDWPWQIIHANERALRADWEVEENPAQILGKIDEGSHLLGRENVHLGAGSRIKPCVVIDAENGPVWIGDNVTIQPHVYIQGPAYIGDGCFIQPGAVIRENTSIGPLCKVGGELEGTIIQGYSNKQHDGFLGHSYVGSWVNLAADSVNSDLKNTYGSVRVPVCGANVDSGERFVGAIIGDHAKIGINVAIPTGASIGFCSNVFVPACPKFVPSFAWVVGEEIEHYNPAKGLELARTVMARRGVTLTADYEAAFRSVFGQSKGLEQWPEDEG